MASRTFPIWAAILIFGAVALFLIGYLNVFIPKEQREKARRIGAGKKRKDETSTVVCDYRIMGSWYFVLPGLVSAAAAVMFFIEDFMVLASFIAEGRIVGYVVAGLIFLIAFFLIGGLLFLIPILGESTSFRDTRAFYWSNYGIKVVEKERMYSDVTAPKPPPK